MNRTYIIALIPAALATVACGDLPTKAAVHVVSEPNVVFADTYSATLTLNGAVNAAQKAHGNDPNVEWPASGTVTCTGGDGSTVGTITVTVTTGADGRATAASIYDLVSGGITQHTVTSDPNSSDLVTAQLARFAGITASVPSDPNDSKSAPSTWFAAVDPGTLTLYTQVNQALTTSTIMGTSTRCSYTAH